MGYLDPGLFGLISQAGLAILFVLVSVFTFFFKPIKKFFNGLFKKKNTETMPASTAETSETVQHE